MEPAPRLKSNAEVGKKIREFTNKPSEASKLQNLGITYFVTILADAALDEVSWGNELMATIYEAIRRQRSALHQRSVRGFSTGA